MTAEQEGPDDADVNVVLTFLDDRGRSWLAGGHLGPLIAEDNAGDTIHVRSIPDLPLTVAGFTVVRGA